MEKLPEQIMEREKEFYHWLIEHTDEKTAVELHTVIPLLNEYGQQRHCLKNTILELTDYMSVQKLRGLIAGDKRYRFMHYSQIKQIMLLIEKYSCFIEEKERDVSSWISAIEEKRTEKLDTTSSVKNEPKGQEKIADQQKAEAERLGVDSQVTMKRVVTLRTVSGGAYYGESPAEALASYCDTLAERHPAIIEKLIGQKYNGQGSVAKNTEKNTINSQEHYDNNTGLFERKDYGQQL